MGDNSVQIDAELCKACGFCVHVCPVKIIRLSSETNSKGYHYALVGDMRKCTGCRFCGIICPEIAIKIASAGKRSSGKESQQNGAIVRKRGPC